MSLSAAPELSVVIATFNRTALLGTLLDDLGAQTYRNFEVIVVDDGSRIAVGPTLEARSDPFPLRHVRQGNLGAGAARHAGIGHAKGDILVIVDDDMAVAPDFLHAHAERHQGGDEVVLGNIQLPNENDALPLFERFHQRTLDRFVEAWRRGEPVVDGGHVCTGNVSLRRRDYERIGGFDLSLAWCEDRDLGTRLEVDGRRFGFAERARSVHRSDHEDVGMWRRRSAIYGESDAQIARKHPQFAKASPWAFLPSLPLLVRPLMVGAALVPRAASAGAHVAYRFGEVLDHKNRTGAAESMATLCYGLDYYCGVAREHGSVRATWASYRAWNRHRAEVSA